MPKQVDLHLIVPVGFLPVILLDFLNDGEPPVSLRAIAGEAKNVSTESLRVQIHQVQVKPLPSPSPACPGPSHHIMGETIGFPALPSVVVQSGIDETHLIVVPVSFQQFFAVAEEIRVGETVIFHNDSFFDLTEKPVNGGHRAGSTAVVLIGKERMKITSPVDRRMDNLSDCRTFFRVSRMSLSWTVLEYVERTWAPFLNGG